MGRYLLGGKEARLPYEVEELDLRLYTIEELCYYIYHHVPLIGDDFINDHLLTFLRKELALPEIADKIERFYNAPSDLDATLLMLLSEVGFYSDQELMEFKSRLVVRRRKNGPERMLMKADSLYAKKRYAKAIRLYRVLAADRGDVRVTPELRGRAFEAMADCYGHMYAFDRAIECAGLAYDELRQERLLKKMYKISVLSGEMLPEKFLKRVPETLLTAWQQEYWNEELLAKNRVENSEMLKIFFKDRKETEEELRKFIAKEKEAYRLMTE